MEDVQDLFQGTNVYISLSADHLQSQLEQKIFIKKMFVKH